MSYRLPPLNGLRAFEAAARHMSFTRAAEELHVTPAALSYQVRNLEQILGVTLFHRLNRAIELTEHGEALFPGIRAGFESMDNAMRRLHRRKETNVLVVSVGPAFAAKWLAPRLYRFIERHPDIDPRISANVQISDFENEQIDIVSIAGHEMAAAEIDPFHARDPFAEARLKRLQCTLQTVRAAFA